MPRPARLDAPDVLHHVMGRGIERGRIIWDDCDKAIFTIVSAIAELERNIIVERIRAGIRKAKENGKRLGRPKRLNLNVEKLKKLRKQGLSFKKIGETLKACPATIYHTLKRLA
jgi:DNA invertase Pin-like site-specific DNA recombinase